MLGGKENIRSQPREQIVNNSCNHIRQGLHTFHICGTVTPSSTCENTSLEAVLDSGLCIDGLYRFIYSNIGPAPIKRGGRSTDIFYTSKSRNIATQKYSTASTSPAFKKQRCSKCTLKYQK